MENKKTIIWQSNFPLSRTGLARNTKSVLSYLYKTNKYNIICYAQGFPWDHPEFSKLPYKVVGCLPMTQQEINQINSDGNYQRACHYGLYYLDRVISEFKPFAMIFSDDEWAFSGYHEKSWWNKFHCIKHITLDSEPLIGDSISNQSKTPLYFTWAPFAQRILNNLGHNHVKTITAAIDPEPFYKISSLEKNELRDKFEIPRNSLIFSYVFRNQLRKTPLQIMEGYVEFKRQNPEAKNTFLLFHTFFPEKNPSGWDIPRGCEELGIDKQELLTTYLCKSCREISIAPYQGEDVDCKFCNAQKSQVGCSVGFGCSEDQLRQVYGISDAYVHGANASGLEIPIIEALYCELVVATMDYAGTSTFTDQPFVHSLDFSWTRQENSQFKRACVYSSAIAKYFTKIYKMSLPDRQKLGKRGREWALSTFSPSIVGKQWEDLFDSLPEHNYNFDFKEELKNPDFPNPNIENEQEWITSLYNNILKCSPDADGLKNWTEGLKHGQSRQQIYEFFIGLAKKQNSEAGQDKVNLEDLFDKEDKRKRVLLTLKESIGDHVILTSLLPAILEKYPENEYCIYVSADQKFWDVHEGNDKIKLIPFFPQFKNELFVTGAGSDKKLTDIFIDLAVSTQTSLNYLSNQY